ncbi:MAG TPA: hypothetical protein VGI64_07440 [Streptosporangiaceae bacterium]
MPSPLTPDDLLETADVVAGALRPVTDLNWAVQAGPLEWDVQRTMTHMIGAVGKYSLYLASRSEQFIAFYLARWEDATNQEVIDSITPVAAALAAIAAVTPPGVRAYHARGMRDGAGFVGLACTEYLLHADDILAGYQIPFAPPDDLCRRLLAHEGPENTAAAEAGEYWPALLRWSGRTPAS